jgi:glycine/serine hydroxymethyltransferase
VADLLEANNVITNPQAFYDDPSFSAVSGVRMGTQEMTRHGMKEADFRKLAALMDEIISDRGAKPADFWRDTVKSFRINFTDMWYCF